MLSEPSPPGPQKQVGPADVLKMLLAREFHFSEQYGRLYVQPASKLTAEDTALVAAHKVGILALVKGGPVHTGRVVDARSMTVFWEGASNEVSTNFDWVMEHRNLPKETMLCGQHWCYLTNQFVGFLWQIKRKGEQTT